MQSPSDETFSDPMGVNDSWMSPTQQAFWQEHWYMTEEERLQFWRRKNGLGSPDLPRAHSRVPNTEFRTAGTPEQAPVFFDSAAAGPADPRIPPPVPSQRYTGPYGSRPGSFVATQQTPENAYPEENWGAAYSSSSMHSPQGMGGFPWPQPGPVMVRSQTSPTADWYDHPRVLESRKAITSAPRPGGREVLEHRPLKRPSPTRDEFSPRALSKMRVGEAPYSPQIARSLERAPIPSYMTEPFPVLDTMHTQIHPIVDNFASSPAPIGHSSQTPLAPFSMRTPTTPSNISFQQASFPQIKDQPSPEESSRPTALRGRSRSSRTEDFGGTSLSVTHPFPCTFPKCGARLKDRYEWKRHEVIHVRADVWFCMPENSAVINGKCAFCESDDISPRHFVDHNLSLCWAKPAHERAFHRKDHLKQHIQALHTPKDHGGRLYRVIEKAWHRHEEPPESALRCPFCDMVFDSWDKRVSHVGQALKAASMLGRGGVSEGPICSRKTESA